MAKGEDSKDDLGITCLAFILYPFLWGFACAIATFAVVMTLRYMGVQI